MKRGIISIKNKSVILPKYEIWMTTEEIAELLYTTAGKVNSVIQKMYKDKLIHENEQHQYRKLEQGLYADVYSIEAIIYITFYIETGHSTFFKNWIIKKLMTTRHKPLMFLINSDSMPS